MPRLLITQGEPSGIGAEVALKALAEIFVAPDIDFTPVILGDADIIDKMARRIGMESAIERIDSIEETRNTRKKIFVLHRACSGNTRPGFFSPESSGTTIDWIKEAAGLCMEAKAQAMVTGPIDKRSLEICGRNEPGHTELLATLTGADSPMMLLAGKKARVALLTTHVALGNVPALIDRPKTLESIQTLNKGLKHDLGIESPSIALAGLNPHAGDSGRFGREEIEKLVPAVRDAVAIGVDIKGPFPADTLFTPSALDRFDAVLACYHDQGLAPLKALEFNTAVNITLNLPIVRTSPSHGPAYDLADKNSADPTSMKMAISLAIEIASRRKSRHP
ncbi:MAG: 4-hydroxythreonine-4-phosphate dehydrogenase PdxA [Deltaproteobacteria bacterium]|nr:4-hydroxythreonine-4-phosphate dehydrogenase PdxA [Deltaproteobacteria bacterium]